MQLQKNKKWLWWGSVTVIQLLKSVANYVDFTNTYPYGSVMQMLLVLQSVGEIAGLLVVVRVLCWAKPRIAAWPPRVHAVVAAAAGCGYVGTMILQPIVTPSEQFAGGASAPLLLGISIAALAVLFMWAIENMVARYAENPVADVVLAEAAADCEACGVRLTIDGCLPRENVIPAEDLAPLLHNMLANAVEAAEKAAPPRFAEVRFRTKANRIGITVENSCAAAVTGETTKQDKENHGFGLRIIEGIVEKYDGLYELKQEGSKVTASAMLAANLGGQQESEP